MRPRVRRAPGLPCALWFGEGEEFLSKLGRNDVARMRNLFHHRPARNFHVSRTRCTVERSPQAGTRFLSRRGWAPARTTARAVLRRGTSSNRLSRIRHRGGKAAVDGDRLSVDIGASSLARNNPIAASSCGCPARFKRIELADLVRAVPRALARSNTGLVMPVSIRPGRPR